MKKITKLALISTLVMLSTSIAQAAITVNISGTNTPSIENVNTMRDVIRINQATAGGVSYNQYDEFNVGANGVIFANNTQNVQASNGQSIAANSALNGRSAQIIINEVIGDSASTLNGNLEIVGDKADLLIVNPNGLTCDGCSFTNVDTLSLVAGKIKQYKYFPTVETVDGSTLTINGLGMDAAGVERTQLIGHNISIDSKLLAGNELLSFAGKTLVDTFAGGSRNLTGPNNPTFDNGSLIITENGEITANQIAVMSIKSNNKRAFVNNGQISTKRLLGSVSSIN